MDANCVWCKNELFLVCFLMKNSDETCRYLRPSMLQHLLRRLVFDVPILNEYAKMPLKVCHFVLFLYWQKTIQNIVFVLIIMSNKTLLYFLKS